MHSPDCLCIAEPKIQNVHGPLTSAGFHHHLGCPPNGRKGGLIFVWKDGLDFEATWISHIINLVLFSDPPHTPWMLTLVHGPSIWREKRTFWNMLKATADHFTRAWICIGDFNALADSMDKWGGRTFVESSQGSLGTFMREQGFVDLGFQGAPFYLEQ